MKISLEQSQVQKLALTPELIQSIKILQCNNQELSALINDELLSNPMLELSDDQPEPSISKEIDERFDWTEHAKERSYDDFASRRIIMESEKDDYNYEQYAKADFSLFDYLHHQLDLIDSDVHIKRIADYVIDTLNDAGYRTERVSEISDRFDLRREDVIEAVHLVQTLEPAGVGARSIPECLKLQLQREEKYNDTYDKILFEHLDDLAENKLNTIVKALDISLDEVKKYCEEIKKLDPKPGLKYGKGQNNKYIVPELEIKELDGNYIVLQTRGVIPVINSSPYYDKLIKEANGDKTTLEYLHKKMDAALWLIKAIDQRQSTIQKVAEYIVDIQKEFFIKGLESLKPLTLKDVAKALDIHESTVSRAINGKHIQTPKGIFELKFFFSKGISSITGVDQSSEYVRRKIKEIVEKEDLHHPYSDEKIKSLLLSNYGIDIARRTIAKYRDQLGIAGTSKRKEY